VFLQMPPLVGRPARLAVDCESCVSMRNFVLVQIVSHRTNQFYVRELSTPVFGFPALSVVGTCDLTIDSPGGVRIVAQIYSEETSLPERIAAVESPERRLKARKRPTSPHDVR
jgi:hypothetical protein